GAFRKRKVRGMRIRWPWRKSAKTEGGDPHFFSSELHALRVKLDIIGPTIKLVHGKSKAAELVDQAAALLDRPAHETETEEALRQSQPPRPQTEGEMVNRVWFEIMNPIAAQSRDPNDKKSAEARRWVNTLTQRDNE